MTWLSDQALANLRESVMVPELSGTRYRLMRPLGHGGMSAVFLVEDTELDRKVALKVLDLPDSSGELTGRLLREARVLARLEHPGIVPVHDVGVLPDGRVYYTMKFVAGTRLDQHARGISLPERLRAFQRICEAAASAHHQGILHRDLKPGNIMVGEFGEVLLLDWGVAKILGSADPSRTAPATLLAGTLPDTAAGSVLGTPGFMSPEQARGGPVDERSDVYSLGAILKFLIPDEGQQPRALLAICGKAMSPEPQDRYASAEELAADVACYLDGMAVRAYPEAVWQRFWRWVSRNRVWILLVLAYLLARMLLLLLSRH